MEEARVGVPIASRVATRVLDTMTPEVAEVAELYEQTKAPVNGASPVLNEGKFLKFLSVLASGVDSRLV